MTYQQQIDSERACIARAILAPAGPGQRPMVPATATREAPEETLHRAIRAASNGDNTLIQAPRGRIAIHELALWNATDAVDIAFWDGPSAADFGKLLYELAAIPASLGFTLGYTADPHFIIREGNPFVLNLGIATTVTGYLKYRILP